MSDSDVTKLRAAVTAHETAVRKQTETAARLRKLDPELVAAEAALTIAEKEFTTVLGQLELGEATQERVAASRTKRDACVEKLCGLVAAANALTARSKESLEAIEGLATNCLVAMQPLARAIAEGGALQCRDLAERLAREMKSWHRFENAGRGNTGFMTGQRAERDLGVTAVLREAGITVELSVHHHERDALTPRELLDLLSPPAKSRTTTVASPEGTSAA